MKTITDFKIHMGLPPQSKKSDVIAIDSEWMRMDKNRLHRPDNGVFACMTVTYNGKDVYVITDVSDLKETFKRIDKGMWVLQNAKFDITHLRRYARIMPRTQLVDTMLIEQVMFSGYYTDFGLDDLVRRYLGVYMDKEVRKQFEKSDKLTREQIEYAAVDTIATWMVYQEQKKIIDKDDLHIWETIERPFLWVLLAMSGITLDKDKWLKLAEENKKEAERIQKKYKTINLNSPAQVGKELLSLGYNMKKGTGEEYLLLIADKCKFAQSVLDFRSVARRSSTYGAKFVDDHVEADGKIYGDIYQMGGETGRTSCRKPNLQNQPSDKRYRECYVPSKENVLVIADWSAQEPRIAGFLSNDEKLIDALKSKEKLYIRIARDAMSKEIKKESKEYKHIKSTVLGIFYGMSAFGLSKRIGVNEDEAQDIIDVILETYPGIQDYITRQEKAQNFVTSINGRKVWLNHYMNGWERNALNAPIQSSAADAMKLAAVCFLKEWEGYDLYQGSPLVLLVHDEICLDVIKKGAPKAMKLLKKCMIDTAESMHPGIPAEVEIGIGNTWADKS